MKLKEKLADTNMCSIPTFLSFVMLVLPKLVLRKIWAWNCTSLDFQWSLRMRKQEIPPKSVKLSV